MFLSRRAWLLGVAAGFTASAWGRQPPKQPPLKITGLKVTPIALPDPQKSAVLQQLGAARDFQDDLREVHPPVRGFMEQRGHAGIDKHPGHLRRLRRVKGG